jgi:hypothetical protein
MCGFAATGTASESEPLSKSNGQTKPIGWGIMKLSIEAKVAAAVATAFVALTVGAIGQEHNRSQTDGLNGYGLTNNSAIETYLSQHGYDSSVADRTNAEADEGN